MPAFFSALVTGSQIINEWKPISLVEDRIDGQNTDRTQRWDRKKDGTERETDR